MYKWSEDTTCRFVSEYKKHECLWNNQSNDYKNHEMRNNAHREMMEAMNLRDFDVADVKSKVKNLRSTYLQEYKKVMFAQQHGNVYTPTIKWFEQMRELMSSTASNIQLKVKSESIKDDWSSEDNTNLEQPVPTKRKSSESKKKKLEANFEYVSIPDVTTSSSAHDLTIWDDEFHHFGMNVASQLRRLPIEKALHAQITIQSVLAEERLTDTQ